MHIFISYAKKDTRPLAEKLAAQLNAISGISAWWDSSLQAGSHWDIQIQREIDRADVVVVLLSPDVNRSTEPRSFVINEIQYAQSKKKRIIPVLAERTDVPLILMGIQYVDVTTTRPIEAQAATIIQRIIGISTPLPTQAQRPHMKLNEPWAMILAAIITGIFAIIAALIATGGGDSEANANLPPTNPPTITATETDLPPTNTDLPPTQTDLPPTNTDLPPTETPTNIPPTETSVTTFVIQSEVQSPSETPTIVKSLPCSATIANPFSAATVINEVYTEASTTSKRGTGIRVGSTISLERVTTDETAQTWYLIYNEDRQRLGWVLEDYVAKSANCP